MNNSRFAYALLALSILIACSSAVHAVTYTDDTDAEFQLGNVTEVNSTADTLTLNISSGTTYAASGMYTSKVFDAGSNPTGTIAWSVTSPSGTSVLVSTRSGNTSNTSVSGWSSWSSDYASAAGSTITSASRRYIQYRVQFGATNTSNTPTLSSVTLTMTDQNTTYTAGTNANLTGNTSGDFTFTANVSDTFTIVNVKARYRLNATGTWSAMSVLNSTSLDLYSYVLSEPALGWDSLANTTLWIDYNATVTNGSVETTTNHSFTEYIDFVNSLPVLDPLSNRTVLQNATVTFTVTATDADSHTLTFTTNQTGAEMTSVSSTSASFNWTPNASQTGFHTITITANDTYGTTTGTFTINVTDVNDAPSLDTVEEISGYYGVRQLLELVAIDTDTYQSVNFSMMPNFFRFETWNRTVNSSTVSSSRWYGRANFTPLDDERGTHNVTFYVTDGVETTNTTAIITIDYCGDATCQTTYETAAICPSDCADNTPVPGIALVAPDRNCVNSSMRVRAFDAQDRFSCYYEGRVVEGLAVCQELDGVSIAVYKTNGTMLTSITSLSTDSSGIASFTPTTAGEYRFFGTKEDYKNTSMIVIVRACEQDILVENNTVTVVQPTTTSPPPRDREPEEQAPLSEEEASWLTILFFYLLAPLLAASLVYLSSVFYDVNKDTLPWLLSSRIWFYEQRQRFTPQLTWLRTKTAPVLNPVKASLVTLWRAAWPPIARLLAPLIERLKSLGKKP